MATVEPNYVNEIVTGINEKKTKKTIYKYLTEMQVAVGDLPTTAEHLTLDAAKQLAVGAATRGVIVSSPAHTGSISSSDLADMKTSIAQLHAKMDELPNLQIKMKEMGKSQAFLASQYEDGDKGWV
ncbi:g1592 [Coccomyxa elongata]